MQIRISGHGSLVIRAGIMATCLLMTACATTTGSGQGPRPIPEGQGRLIIEAGGIRQLNYYIVDQDTDEEIFSDHPRCRLIAVAGEPDEPVFRKGSGRERARGNATA